MHVLLVGHYISEPSKMEIYTLIRKHLPKHGKVYEYATSNTVNVFVVVEDVPLDITQLAKVDRRLTIMHSDFPWRKDALEVHEVDAEGDSVDGYVRVIEGAMPILPVTKSSITSEVEQALQRAVATMTS